MKSLDPVIRLRPEAGVEHFCERRDRSFTDAKVEAVKANILKACRRPHFVYGGRLRAGGARGRRDD